MPIRYERDDARRRVVVTIEGAFQTSDMVAVIERQRAEDTWSYGLLYDLRHLTGQPTIADLREILAKVANRPRGPVAIVATDPAIYERACTYAALGRSTLTIEVFAALEEAERWLTATLKG